MIKNSRMYSWTDTYERMHSVLYKQRDMFPYPSSCTDTELLDFWNETKDNYEHYLSVYEQLNFDTDAEEETFLKRIDTLEELLDDIDFEWNRRTWLTGTTSSID